MTYPLKDRRLLSPSEKRDENGVFGSGGFPGLRSGTSAVGNHSGRTSRKGIRGKESFQRRNGSRILLCPTRPKRNISGRRANCGLPGRERKNALLRPPGRLREDIHPTPKGGVFQRCLPRRHRSSFEYQNPRPPGDLERFSASRDGFPKSLPKTRPTLTRHKRAPEARNYCPWIMTKTPGRQISVER